MSNAPFGVQLVAAAFVEAGERADLSAVYRNMAALFPDWPDHYKDEASFRATVRSTIESYCPQSENYQEDREAFFERIARGRYRLVPPEEREAVKQRGRTLN